MTEQTVPDQQNGADKDGGIRNIKGGPMPSSIVDIDEVDDMPVQNTVYRIADGTAQDQRQRQRHAGLPGRQTPQPCH